MNVESCMEFLVTESRWRAICRNTPIANFTNHAACCPWFIQHYWIHGTFPKALRVIGCWSLRYTTTQKNTCRSVHITFRASNPSPKSVISMHLSKIQESNVCLPWSRQRDAIVEIHWGSQLPKHQACDLAWRELKGSVHAGRWDGPPWSTTSASM